MADGGASESETRSSAFGRIAVLTPEQLRDKARGMREEAACIRGTLDHVTPMRRAGLRARAERMEQLAQELERAAQKSEATGQ
jgi:hypothetical protein